MPDAIELSERALSLKVTLRESLDGPWPLEYKPILAIQRRLITFECADVIQRHFSDEEQEELIYPFFVKIKAYSHSTFSFLGSKISQCSNKEESNLLELLINVTQRLLDQTTLEDWITYCTSMFEWTSFCQNICSISDKVSNACARATGIQTPASLTDR
jgi:hypothetical protein